jgi:glycosidase
LELFGGKKGSMAAFVVVAYMKGIPFIYNGQEVGMPTQLKFPFTRSKVDWTLNPDVTAEYKKIIAFRNKSEVVRRGLLTSYSNADVCAFTKTEGSKKVLVLSNLRDKTITYAVPSNLIDSNWKDAFTGAKSKLNTTIDLAPFSYLVLKN